MNDRNRFEKKELQNKLQGFEEGKDYTVSSVEGKQVYDICSEDLKKSLWGDQVPVWCKVEVYDRENEHYRGRFEGYENGYHSVQIWWRGENPNTAEHLKIWGGSHPDFDHFKHFQEEFFNNPDIFEISRASGNVFEGREIRERFRRGSIERKASDSEKSMKWSVTFDPPGEHQRALGNEDYRVCQCKSAIKRTIPGDNNRCLECGQIFKRGVNRENIKEACFDCGRAAEIRTNYTAAGRNSVQGDGHFRCGECNARYTRYIKYLQEKLAKEDEKNQQITNLQGQLNQKEEQLTKSSQQLETERQAKKEVERNLEESKTQQEQVQNELIQLREELVKVRQELTQAQKKLKKQMEKSPQTNTEQLIEKLGKSGKDLTASQKLVQSPKLNHQDIIEVKNQLDNSRRILVAAAAHTQSVERTMPLQLREQVKPTKTREQSTKVNYLPYLISGFAISGLLVLGLLFWQKKKRK